MDILNNEFLLFLKCAQENSLRYLLIGGYAVNYYGYNRHTADMDIWLAPDNKNKQAFINTLLCMNYSQKEVEPLTNEDFSAHFVGTIGSADAAIDVLTFVHRSISYTEAENQKNVFEIQPGLFLNIVPYQMLIEMKLRSHREKDMFDIARLEEIKNQQDPDKKT
ncbi:MAG TPA: hypothetical protein VI548_09555 [Chitinophagaceae bacterium]|nr:hypothetical protein [Chitinophagaceae bacterium]